MNSTSHSPNGEFTLLLNQGASGEFSFIGSKIMLNYFRWFDANHLHGTIMPRQSSFNTVPPPTSIGAHKTVRVKDVEKASVRKQVRVGYQARTAYWSADDVEMTEAE